MNVKRYTAIVPVLLLLILITACKDEVHWTVSELPETKYFFRDLDEPLGTEEKEQQAKLKSHQAVIDLSQESRDFKTPVVKKAFFRIDLKNARVKEGGLEIVGPVPERVDQKVIRTRPAGKYLVGEFSGSSEDVRSIFRELAVTLERMQLKVKGSECFYYKRTALPTRGESIRMLFPLE